MNLGKIIDESGDTYHATQAISNTKLKVFARRPGGQQLFYQRFIAKTLHEGDKQALIEGRALHAIVLEPEKFPLEFEVEPLDAPDRPTEKMINAKDPSPSSIARVKFWKEFDERTKGKTIIDDKTFRMLSKVATQIERHPSAAELLEEGEPEVTWRIKAGGLKNLWPLQIRTDWFNPNGCKLSEGRPYVVDVKSCASLDAEAFGSFSKGAEERGYHTQFALYLAVLQAMGVECRDFFVIAAEKTAPYGVECYRMGDRALEEGQNIVDGLLTELDGCFERNEWPNTSLGVQEYKLSGRYWAKKKNLEETFV
jgi:hypothetical protein